MLGKVGGGFVPKCIFSMLPKGLENVYTGLMGSNCLAVEEEGMK